MRRWTRFTTSTYADGEGQSSPSRARHSDYALTQTELINRYLRSETSSEISVTTALNQPAIGPNSTPYSYRPAPILGPERQGSIVARDEVGSVEVSGPSDLDRIPLPGAGATDEQSYDAVSIENVIVSGSRRKRQLTAQSSRLDYSASISADYPYHQLPCNICQNEIGKDVEGREFVPCECAFRICRACYEHVRSNEGNRCPQCGSRYRRMKGSPPIAGDSTEDILEHLEEQLPPEVELPVVEDTEEAHAADRVMIAPTLASSHHNSRAMSVGTDVTSDSLVLQVMDPSKNMTDYGYGSIAWIPEGQQIGDGEPPISGGGDTPAGVPLMVDDTRRPLSRKVPVVPGLLNPYRFVVTLRFFVTLAFFYFRITHPNNDAYYIWITSVICEIWFGISWLFDQVPKWSPITRETYLNRLALRYEPEGASSSLPFIDVFVSTADPDKEPPLVTANVVLSILAAEYPVEKLALYVSDDGGAMLTFEALTKTANFARFWVPFCKKYSIEPRAPEVYFSSHVDYLKGKVQAAFVRDRRRMKREYDEFKVGINSLVAKSQDMPRDGWKMPDGTPWPGNLRTDHVAMIQVFLQPDSGSRDVDGNPLPRLLYLSREKRSGYEHNKKAGAMNALMRASALITNAPFILNLDCDHYINNAQAIREAVCFLVDPLKGARVCYVQFPQRFDGVDRNDRYANHNTVFYDVNLKGQDGQQGPMYVGTGCVFRRQALYGYLPPSVKHKKPRSCCCPGWIPLARRHSSSKQTAPEPEPKGPEDEERLRPASKISKVHVKRFGMCHNFLETTEDAEGGRMASNDNREVLGDVILVISCGYEDNTEWGKTIGWVYGSVTEDIVTGYMMHTRGWRSVYCMPKRPAFKGSAPINLTDRLAQVLRWATGSVEIFFSGHNPLWGDCCTGLKLIQRISYINTTIYPFTSLALVVYCLIPAVCLFANQFIIKNITSLALLYFLGLFLSIFASALLEVRWSGVSLEEWWRNEQFWVIGGTSAHLAAVLQGLLKVFAGIDVHFTLTAKAGDGEDDMSELYTVRWTWLFLVPTTIILVNCFAILAGIAHAVNGSTSRIGQLIGQTFFSVWVLLHLYPFAKGLSGRSQKMPTLVIIWSCLLAIILSLIWAKT